MSVKFTPPVMEGSRERQIKSYHYQYDGNGAATQKWYIDWCGTGNGDWYHQPADVNIPLMPWPDGSEREARTYSLRWEREYRGFHSWKEEWSFPISNSIYVVCKRTSYVHTDGHTCWMFFDNEAKTCKTVWNDGLELFKKFHPQFRDKWTQRTTSMIPSEYRANHAIKDLRSSHFPGVFLENCEYDNKGRCIRCWNSEGEEAIFTYDGDVLQKVKHSLLYDNVTEELFYENGKFVTSKITPESAKAPNFHYPRFYPYPCADARNY